MKHTPFDTITRVAQRTTSAVVARSGTRSAALREYLTSAMGGVGQPGSFLSDPLIEAAHSFVPAKERLEDLAGKLLRLDLVEALDGGDTLETGDRERHRFRKSWHPFRHQVEAWKVLLASEPKSVMVTSGTGSGKTECFLVPLLNSLVEQAAAGRTMIGVQAIMLYPLNALISSQRERLSDWTAPFGGKVRFSLFNGETPQTAPEMERRRKPEEVIDRAMLRASPPPMLVTNITMLEYILVRFEDRPILEKSQGKLRYIILDEAHSYVGSQAAELSLLLRRVLYAFGVESKNVRFVATSATIGKQGDPQTKAGLQRFLAQVAGVPEAQVVLIEGHRKTPQLPALKPSTILPGPAEMNKLEAEALFERLGSTPAYVNGFNKVSLEPTGFKKWCEAIGTSDPDIGKSILAAGSRAEKAGEKLLPLRIHAFHRSQGGAWACLNPDCTGRKGSKLDDVTWGFGAVQLEHTDLCPHCQSPMLEIKYCSRCGQVSLAAERVPDKQGREWLTPLPLEDVEDEFFSELEQSEAGSTADEGDEEGHGGETTQFFDQTSHQVLVAPLAASYGSIQNIDCDSGQIRDQPQPTSKKFRLEHPCACPHCGATFSSRAERLFSIRMGAPFLLGSIVPELLDDAPSARYPIRNGKPDLRLRPADGHQVLMFTDSRQGTARLSAKLQRDAEQNYIRAFIYHTLQATVGAGNASKQQERQKLETDLTLLRAAVIHTPGLHDIIEEQKRKLAALDQPEPITWTRMVQSIASDDRIERFIRSEVWVTRESEFSKGNQFAEFLLLREFLRQPVRANSIETMGLATLRFKHFEDIGEHQVSDVFKARGGTLKDWRDFLYIAMTRFARQNWCVHVDPVLLHWISHKGSLKTIKPPAQKFDNKYAIAWPSKPKLEERRQLVRLLVQGMNFSLDDSGDRDDIDDCLQKAWQQFKGVCHSMEDGFRLDFHKASIAPIQECYGCPVTPGLFRDRTFRGLSPNPPFRDAPFLQANKLALPTLPFPYHQDAGEPVDNSRVAAWLDNDPTVQFLRRLGLWSDLHDRIAQYSVYFRAAEHSAQQPGERLRTYEKEFKAGRVNILSCSTTMEMGVDIGSISTVVMSNVPPSIASYRQRVGRVGRRGQAMALSLTLCKDRPLDRSVFRNPESFLGRTILAPSVALDSAVIVQRHVNATMLSRFLAAQRTELHKIPVGPFFGFKRDGDAMDPGTSLSEGFIIWIDTDSLRSDPALTKELGLLLVGTALDGAYLSALDETREAIHLAREEFARECEAIRFDLTDTKDNAPRTFALQRQIKRLTGEYLLGDLAGRGFLPSYGFPTDVVNFDNHVFVKGEQLAPKPGDVSPTSDSANRRFHRRDTPSRQLDLAIRDYSPGTDVVVDGRVYRSAGLTLDWKRPVTKENSRNIQSLGVAWRCKNCGATGTTHADPKVCSSCGVENLTTHRYLKPAGFSCDPWEKPHDKIEEVSFIKPRAAWVAAQGGDWVHLTAREAGRHRASRTGIVFHHTLGSDGYGYAICLACGRAEPETNPQNEGPPLPHGMATHRPLHAKRAANYRCDGADPANPFAIQRFRALGYEVTTDVFEVQLPGLPSASVALPLAAALRDALARKLGVDDAEMGMTATQTMGEDGVGCWSILIYDKAPGGAGFSVAAGNHVEDLLKDAVAILDCPNGAICKTGCPECVMCRDLESHESQIDRIDAFRLAKSLVRQLGLPSELVIFGAGTRAESQPLADAILREMEQRPNAELVLWLLGNSSDWDLNRWAARRIAQRLAARERRIRIMLDESTLNNLDLAGRIELYGLAITTGCILEGAPSLPLVKNHQVLAWVGEGDKGLAWAHRDKTAGIGNASWGGSGKELLVRGEFKIVGIRSHLVDPTKFLMAPGRTTLIDVTTQLNGDIEAFGAAFWSLVAKNAPAIGRRASATTSLRFIEYSDRYLNSPLPVRLLREVLTKAPGIDAATIVKLTTGDAVFGMHHSSPTLLKHDWRLSAHRDVVLQDVFAADFGSRFCLLKKPKHQVSHGRTLRLEYANGVVSVLLDQGFGFWVPQRPIRFDFSAGEVDQVRDLKEVRFFVEPGQSNASWICVNEES